MGTRTHIAGAYRYAFQGEVLPVVETFQFAAADSLRGGNGWTLSSMREWQDETFVETHLSAEEGPSLRGDLLIDITVRAKGAWQHPLHRGDWHRVITQELEVVWDQRRKDVRALVELSERSLRVTTTRDSTQTTRPISVAEGTVLFAPVAGLIGTVIEQVARPTNFPTSAEASGHVVAQVRPLPEDVVTCVSATVTSMGAGSIETPEGPRYGMGYQLTISGADETQRSDGASHVVDGLAGMGAHHDNQFVVAGDGLLSAYRIGDLRCWRVIDSRVGSRAIRSVN